MRCIIVAGSLVLAILASGASAQQQSTAMFSDEPQGETIVWYAQVELARAGLYEGPLNGTMTFETEEAVEGFEYEIGWPETGKVTPDLIIALKRYNGMVTIEY